MNKTRHIDVLLDRVSGWFGSPRLFWWPFGVFLFAALWMACSGAYSMAYDEYYHFGIIKLYAHQWSPFFAQQPPGAAAFGAVTRDPSYLYHYLISFPFRVFAHFVHTFMAQIIFLRVIDVAFFAGGLLIFRALLKRTGLSRRVSNLALGFCMLLPVTPFVAAQINYDDSLFLLSALSIWLAIVVSRALRKRREVRSVALLWLVAVVLLTSLVKYAYLPILAALFIYFVVLGVRTFGWRLRNWWEAIRAGFAGTKRWHVVLAVLFAIIGAGLFAERYGINLVHYHSPTPKCDQVMSVQECNSFAPFARNYSYHQDNESAELPAAQIMQYPFKNWIGGMVRSLLFVVANKQSGYQPGEPLPLTYAAGYIVFVGGLLLVLVSIRWLWRRSYTNQLLLVVSVIYTVTLFVQNFADFVHTQVPVAIQGRYLVPILPLFLVLVVQAAGRLLHAVHPRAAIIVIIILAVLLFEGGSLFPFLIRQHDNWLWNAPAVRDMNHGLRDAVKPFIVQRLI
ncbi:MAG TPA: hypothetical protein VF261_02135 [Candidatus Saccharimonadales bacterium]